MLVIAGLTLVSSAQTEEAKRRKDAARAEKRNHGEITYSDSSYIHSDWMERGKCSGTGRFHESKRVWPEKKDDLPSVPF